ncbi:hypothetical protein AGLY_012234 [Aphis glycines]|uniref:Uncharacterized protein n=1 Tax=Aphis glycines TaxID=307491 RepID=A0A6G0T9V4_APHGL|nr:hypothetical protein AGLY_012234 [Aphis glycines]
MLDEYFNNKVPQPITTKKESENYLKCLNDTYEIHKSSNMSIKCHAFLRERVPVNVLALHLPRFGYKPNLSKRLKNMTVFQAKNQKKTEISSENNHLTFNYHGYNGWHSIDCTKKLKQDKGKSTTIKSIPQTKGDTNINMNSDLDTRTITTILDELIKNQITSNDTILTLRNQILELEKTLKEKDGILTIRNCFGRLDQKQKNLNTDISEQGILHNVNDNQFQIPNYTMFKVTNYEYINQNDGIIAFINNSITNTQSRSKLNNPPNPKIIKQVDDLKLSSILKNCDWSLVVNDSNVHINQINDLNTHGKLVCYADDTVVFVEFQSWDEVFASVQSDMNILKLKTIKVVYQALMGSKIDYGISIWGVYLFDGTPLFNLTVS